MTTTSQLSRARQPTILVLESQAIWSTVIASSMPDCKVTCVPNLDTLQSHCDETHGNLAIIQIGLSDRHYPDCNAFLALNVAIGQLRDCPFFAVGDKPLKKYHNQLLAVGFAEVFGGISTADRLVRMAQQYFASVGRPKMTIEDRVRRSLPWRATSINRISKIQKQLTHPANPIEKP